MSNQHFSPQLTTLIQKELVRYETKRTSILPILHAIQDEQDWISPKDVEALEKEFGLSAVDVQEVLTFYTMYRKNPPKPWRFEVCNSISCWLMGSEKTLQTIQNKLDECKAQGKELPVECHKVECLGVCGFAPVALINKDRHLNVTPELALKLLEIYASKPLPEAAVVCQKKLNP
jgi:NADH-quinone oxidoreductase subunit E